MAISVGSVAVDVVPDTRTFATQLKAKLKDVIAHIDADVDTTAIREKVKESTKSAPVKVKVSPEMDTFAAKLKSEAAAIAKSATVDLPLTADGEKLRREITEQTALISKLAKVEIPVDLEDAAALRNKMALELDILKTMAAQANPTVNVDADTGMAEAKIAALGGNGSRAAMGIGALGSSLLLLGPALVPITAAIGGLAGALAAPVAAAGGGLTVFGLIAGAAVKDTNKQIKQIDDLRKKMEAAKDALAASTAGSNASAANASSAAQRSAANANAAAIRSAELSIANARASAASATTPAARAAAQRRVAAAEASLAARQASIQASLSSRSASIQASSAATQAAAQAKVTEATEAYKTALDALTPAQKKFMDSKLELKASFKELVTAAGPAVFGPLVQGMNLLAGVLPKLKPLLKPVSDAIGTLLSDLGGFAKGSGFKSFITGFGKSASSAIVTFGHIFGNTIEGVFGLFKAFKPLSGAFVGALGDLTKKFADFGKTAGANKGFQSFLDYVRAVGPKVTAFFGNLVGALVNIGRALAPVGGLALELADGLLQLIKNAPPSLLLAIAGAIAAIGIAVAVATGGLSLVIPAIAGLVAGILYAYENFKPFRDIVNGVGKALRDNVLPVLKDAYQTALPALKDAFNSVKDSVERNHGLFVLIGDAIKAVAGFILKVLIPAQVHLWKVELPLLGKAIGKTIDYVGLYVKSLLAMAKVGVEAFKAVATIALFAFGAILRGAARAFGWIPGIGPKIKKASAGFDEFRAQTIKNLNKTAAKIQHVQDLLNGIKPKPIILDVVTRTHAQGKVDRQLGIPRGATGGIVTRPTLAVIGEAGPEAVVPLNKTPGSHPLTGGGTQEIRGVLSLDERGVATIRGAGRSAVSAAHRQRAADARNRAIGGVTFQ